MADERARRAELEKVRVEGERMTSEAQAAERRKRRQLWLGAASLLAVTVVGGLATVVAVQRRANAELVSEQAKVQARFDTAEPPGRECLAGSLVNTDAPACQTGAG